jgi:predicted transcriptional regulator
VSSTLSASEQPFSRSVTVTVQPDADLSDLLQPVEELASIEFKPIELKFETGAPIPDDYEITIDVSPEDVANGVTKVIEIADLEDELNEIERNLNKYGKSLRDLPAFETLTEIPVAKELLQEQQARLQKLIADFDPAKMRALLSPEQFDELVEKAKAEAKDQVLKKVRELVAESEIPDLDLPDLDLPAVKPPKPVEIPEFEADKTRTWRFFEGDPNVVAAYAEANMRSRGLAKKTSKEAAGQVDGTFGVYLVRQPKIELGGGFANFVSPESGKQQARVRFEIAGKEIYDENFAGDTPKWGDSWSKSVDQHKQFSFSCGPVECIVRLGARGRVYYNWRAGLGALRVYGKADAGVQADAYAQAEATVARIAGVGADASLLIFRDEISLEADAVVRLDERDVPYIETGIEGYNTVEALSGSVSAYAYVRIPECQSGDFYGVSYPKCSTTKKKQSTPIFNWDGFYDRGNILSFHMKLSPFGYEFDGREEDIRPEDVRQAKELQKQGNQIDLADRLNHLRNSQSRYNREARELASGLRRFFENQRPDSYVSALVDQNEQIADKIEGVAQQL